MRRCVGRPIGATIARALRLSGRRIGIALVVHGVGCTSGGPHEGDSDVLAATMFEAHLRHIRAHYSVVPADALLAAVRSRRRGDPFPVALTFDDDRASHARLAMPILQSLALPATFFLNGVALAGDNSPDDQLLVERLASRLNTSVADATLSAGDVSALAAGGFAIGHHTLAHEDLTQLDDEALRHALIDGRRQMEEVAGCPIRAVAYPYGLADRRVAGKAAGAGFDSGFTTSSESVGPDADPLLLGRLQPSHESTGHLALQLAHRLFAPGTTGLPERLTRAGGGGGVERAERAD